MTEIEEHGDRLQEVWKFPLPMPIAGWAETVMPVDARVLHVGVQNELICLWALVSPDAPRFARRFRIVGTGWPLAKAGAYLATVETGPHVWHVFEDGHDAPA
jgi:hypothetical protein